MLEAARGIKGFQPTVSDALMPSTLDDAFPDVDPGVTAFGNRVVVQVRTPMRVTKGGIQIPPEVRETELWNTQVAKVRGVGPVAFRDFKSLEPWPEGVWCKVGDFVRIPKFGGDRWLIAVPGDEALFVTFTASDLIGLVTTDPLQIKAYI